MTVPAGLLGLTGAGSEMLSATQVYPTTMALTVVLWIEAVVYLGIGLIELFDDFLVKPRPWMRINDRANGYVVLSHKIGHKMHAGLCVILGFVALNGLLEGAVTRLDLELIFISFAVIMATLWATLLPGRLGPVVLSLKPEFWLQIVMFVLFRHLVRPQVLGLCLALNAWGIIVYVFHTRRTLFQPYTYAQLRQDWAAAEGEAAAARFDKLAGRTPDAARPVEDAAP